MKIKVYNQEGKAVSEALLPKEIFEVPFNSDLVHQAVTIQKGNRRQVIAHTKDRSEVRGGGKKPWQQKGTGRARHGSIRSPLWKGGGVTFGPRKQRVFKRDMPQKMRRKALFMVLSVKAKENFLIVLDKIEIENIKTKTMAEILKKLPCKSESCLISLPKLDKKIVLSARNIPRLKTLEARNLNVLDLLSSKYLILPKESVKMIRETFLK
ncbi:MAG: 50S ribosomal protein L4 [Candidatus Nealsonbacteria bacterium]|nr:50S ribosomal protein L4 [Candidatus Nealsonbacteria bacterium]